MRLDIYGQFVVSVVRSNGGWSKGRPPAIGESRGFQNRLAEQEALVRRLIVQGAPTQAAEDRLRQLEQNRTRHIETIHHHLGDPLG